MTTAPASTPTRTTTPAAAALAERIDTARSAAISGRPPVDEHAPVMVRVNGLAKRFKMYPQPWSRVAEWVTAGFVKTHQDFWAVENVSFELKRGECIGIIGANGSGKSTLLKMINGSLYPTSGSVEMTGRVLSLLELGAGLNQQLTGRQNIYNLARLLAFPPDFAATKMEEIENFAGLGDFFDRPVIMYSSGMVVRLAFSMFACFEPEVFIVDEALSVGDVFFQQRCTRRIDELLSRGVTMMFVSHDMTSVRRLCHRVILLHQGKVQYSGTPDEAVARYYAVMRSKDRVPSAPAPNDPLPPAAAATGESTPARGASSPAISGSSTLGSASAQDLRAAITRNSIMPASPSRHGTGAITVLAVDVVDSDGARTGAVEMTETAVIRMLYRANRTIAQPSSGVHLYDRFGQLVFAAGTRQLEITMPPMAAGEERIVEFCVGMSILPGEYTFSVGCSEPSMENFHGGVLHDSVENLGPICVTQDIGRVRPFYGMAQLPMAITYLPLNAERSR